MLSTTLCSVYPKLKYLLSCQARLVQMAIVLIELDLSHTYGLIYSKMTHICQNYVHLQKDGYTSVIPLRKGIAFYP